MDWGYMFPKAALLLAWESAGSTSKSVFLDSFSSPRIQTSSVLFSGFQHSVSSQNLWYWKSNTAHSKKMRQYCQISALSPPSALRRTSPIHLGRWMEECLPHTVPMVASSWATSLGLLSLGEKVLHGPTVHICTRLWSRCTTGDSTLSSHKILRRRIRYIFCIHVLIIWFRVVQAILTLQVVREHYGHFARKEAALRVSFESSKITLGIPEDGMVTKKGWRIIPFTSPSVRHGPPVYNLWNSQTCISTLSPDLQEGCRPLCTRSVDSRVSADCGMGRGGAEACATETQSGSHWSQGTI